MDTTTKTCTKCGETKPLGGFYKDKTKKMGVSSRCKPCGIAASNKYYSDNKELISERRKESYDPEKRREQGVKYRAENSEKIKESYREYYSRTREERLKYQEWYRINHRDSYLASKRRERQKNRDKYQERGKEYYQKNKANYSFYARKYKAGKLNATPSWLTQTQLDYMKELYQFRHNISGVEGREYHVDHIVPLQGENVCGLHVPWNLQVIPAKDNLSKSNSTDHLDTL